jgi:hypothetical protein
MTRLFKSLPIFWGCLLFFVINSPSVLSAEGDETGTGDSAVEEDPRAFDVIIANSAPEDVENAILNDAQLKEVYEKCQKGSESSNPNNQETKSAEEINQCIDDEISSKPELQKKLLEKLPKSKKDEKNSPRFDALNTLKVRKNTNPGLDALEDYLKKRLSEALYNQDPNEKALVPVDGKPIRVVDHSQFYSFFKTQVGKNIVSSVTSYCIEANPKKLDPSDDAAHLFLISSDKDKRKTQREDNIKQLTQSSSKKATPAPGGNQQKATLTSAAADNWLNCIQRLPFICSADKIIVEPGAAPGVLIDYLKLKVKSGGSSSSPPTDLEKDHTYSQERACVVVNYMKGAKQNLINVKSIEDQFGKRNEKNGAQGAAPRLDVGKVESYNSSDPDQKSVDELTSISSGEFVENSGHKEALEKQKKDIKDCIDNQNQENCKKFLDVEKNKSQEDFAELKLKTKAQLEQLRDPKEFKEEDLRKLLAEEGRSEDQIDALIKSGGGVDIIKESVRKKYLAEKEALIRSIAKQIDDNTSSTDGKVDLSQGEDKNKLTIKGEDIGARSDIIKENIHFNNIVSGYFNIKDAEGNSSQNTASIFRELENSAFSQDKNKKGRKTAASGSKKGVDLDYKEINPGDKHVEELKKIVEKSGVEDTRGADDADSIALDVDTINTKLLNHVRQKEEKDGKK